MTLSARKTTSEASPSASLQLLETGDEHLRLLRTQSDLQYHAAPVRGIFNAPAATGMGFWSINPYVGCAFGCAYCYARDTHRWTIERAGNVGVEVAGNLPPWLAFERRILVKENAAALVRSAFRSGRALAPGESVVIGSATDPYQPAERHHRITRQVLEVLAEVRGVGVTIITSASNARTTSPASPASSIVSRVMVPDPIAGVSPPGPGVGPAPTVP